MKNQIQIVFLISVVAVFVVFAIGCAKETDNKTNSGNTFTDLRDGNDYKTIKIGEQIWMAQNLRFLPEVYHPQAGSNSHPLYYVYGYYGKATENGYTTYVSEAKLTDNYFSYGVLYNWYSAITSCPEGWHLPKKQEWEKLLDYLGGDSIAGHKLRTGELLWDDPYNGPDTTSTNESGFSANPGGRRNNGGTFGGMGMYGYFWSSDDTPVGTAWDGNAWYVVLVNNDSVVGLHNYSGKQTGFSVRCVKD